MDFIKLATDRFSTRDFSEKKIEEKKLEIIKEAARVAPTAKNNQPQILYLLKSEEALKKIRENTRCAFNAPAVFAICIDETKQWKQPFTGEYMGNVDAAIVTTHMMLAAESIGLGSCFVCYFDVEKFKKDFDIPEYIKPVALLPVGYKSDSCEPAERHFLRNEIEDFITEL
jgi:nitroreductase